MRIRRRLGLLLAAALAIPLAACGSSSSGAGGNTYPVAQNPTFAPGSTMARLHSQGTITVGVKYDQPGVGALNPATNQPEGFDIEIAKIVAAGLGIPADKIKFVEAVSKNREPFIENGQVDIVVASYSITDERKKIVSFAGPYYVTGQQLLVKKGDNSITGPDTLSGKKVCSVTGSTPLAAIQQKYPSAIAVPFSTYTECVQQLLNGSVDAVTTDGAILQGYAAQQPDKLKVVGQPFSTELYGIGLKKDDTAFRNFIDDELQKAYGDGDWAKAYQSTLGKSGDPVPTPPAIQRY